MNDAGTGIVVQDPQYPVSQPLPVGLALDGKFGAGHHQPEHVVGSHNSCSGKRQGATGDWFNEHRTIGR
jgi:hypothetical protein